MTTFTPIATPVAAKRPKTLTLHGHSRRDDYAWLKDPNWKKVIKDPGRLSAEIREYLDAENHYLETVLADTAQLQKELFAELRARIKEDDRTVPARDGEYHYFVRYEKDRQYPVYCRYHRTCPEREEVLLDANEAAKEHSYLDIGEADHSPDHRYFAYSIDVKGSEFYTLYVRDLQSGALLPERIENIQSDFVWAQDSRTLFYATLDDNHRPDKVLRHTLGEKRDAIVYRESDPGFFVNLDVTESRNFILISTHDHVTSEVYTVDARHPRRPARLFAQRQTGIEYEISDHGSFFYIVTNADGAEDYKIMRTPLHSTSRENWRDCYVPPAGTLLEEIHLFADYLVRAERVNGLPRIVITELRENTLGSEHCIEFTEEAFELEMVPGYEFATDTLRLAYTSMTTPTQIFDYHIRDRRRTLRKEQRIPSGHNKDDFITRRLFAAAEDGETVPISLLYRKDTPIDGSAPLLLYAYGAYGNSIPASFSTHRLSLVNRGFIYAIAHVRGGMEKGYAWYRNGKLNNKANTFRDYIACAEYLIGQNYTQAGRIAVHGGSAGGMLVGAAVNMRPDLFNAAVAEVPFVDVLNTMSDETLPLTPPEWPEWGNPLRNSEEYLAIREYSAYDNVARQAYPNILVTAGLTDPRVTYWEPAKWVAKLRERKTDNNLLVLKMNMGAGHSGASGRFDFLEEVALKYAFLLKVFGMADWLPSCTQSGHNRTPARLDTPSCEAAFQTTRGENEEWW